MQDLWYLTQETEFFIREASRALQLSVATSEDLGLRIPQIVSGNRTDYINLRGNFYRIHKILSIEQLCRF